MYVFCLVTFREEGVDWNVSSTSRLSAISVTIREEGLDWNCASRSRDYPCSWSPSARKVWIEIEVKNRGIHDCWQVTFREEGVDWNLIRYTIVNLIVLGHLPRGRCGLKLNITILQMSQTGASPSARKVWIEILSNRPQWDNAPRSPSARKVWIEIWMWFDLL